MRLSYRRSPARVLRVCSAGPKGLRLKRDNQLAALAAVEIQRSARAHLASKNMSEYHLVGEPFDENNRPSIFELRIQDHLNDIDPINFHIRKEVPSLDPKSYYITSGDALAKTMQLEHDLWSLAGKLRAMYKNKYKKYVGAVWKCAGKCRALNNLLSAVKGDACFLETEWSSDGELLCIPKNPRRKQ